VPVRVSPTDRIRHHIDELFAADRPLPEILEEVARLGAQLLMQAALEAEVTSAVTGMPVPRALRMPGPGPVTGTGR
jgi:putative transposase